MPNTATLVTSGWTTKWADLEPGGGTQWDFFRAIRDALNATHVLTKLPVTRQVNSSDFTCAWATRYLIPNANNSTGHNFASIYDPAYFFPPQTDVLEIAAGFSNVITEDAHTICVLGNKPPGAVQLRAVFHWRARQLNPYAPSHVIRLYSEYMTLPVLCSGVTKDMYVRTGDSLVGPNNIPGVVDELAATISSPTLPCIEGHADQNSACFGTPFPKNQIECQLSW